MTVAVAAMTSVVLAFAPLGSSQSCVASDGSPSVCTSSHVSLLQNEGASVLVVLGVPIVLALAALVWSDRRVALGAAVGLTLGALLGAMSVGVFYVPTVILAWLTASAAADRSGGGRVSSAVPSTGP